MNSNSPSSVFPAPSVTPSTLFALSSFLTTNLYSLDVPETTVDAPKNTEPSFISFSISFDFNSGINAPVLVLSSFVKSACSPLKYLVNAAVASSVLVTLFSILTFFLISEFILFIISSSICFLNFAISPAGASVGWSVGLSSLGALSSVATPSTAVCTAPITSSITSSFVLVAVSSVCVASTFATSASFVIFSSPFLFCFIVSTPAPGTAPLMTSEPSAKSNSSMIKALIVLVPVLKSANSAFL